MVAMTAVSNDAAHKTIAAVRRCDAAEKDIPRPVAAATYAARQTGHFGKSARMMVGKTHPAIFRARRHPAGVFGACRPSQQALICEPPAHGSTSRNHAEAVRTCRD